MRFITNNYRESQVLDLGSEGTRGPFLVMQIGVAPNEEVPKTRMFVLRPDGRWVDFSAYASQGKPEAMDELVFFSMAHVMTTFGRLTPRPLILNLPVDAAGLDAWLERTKDQDLLVLAREWAKGYRARHP